MVTTTISLGTKLITSETQRPLFVTAPPGDQNRLFIVEQKTGWIRIFNLQTQQLQATPFLAIPGTELRTGGFEQGLLGLAFHPDFANNGKFYVSYSAVGGGDAGQNKLVEYQVNPNNPNLANPSSARLIMTRNQPASNHNGGWLGFGADGYLYWSTGDGGGSGFVQRIPDESDNAQDLNSPLGKILRLDVDSADAFLNDPLRNYAIPADNPFVNQPGLDEIWNYGLRNPWRPSFDRLTGDMYIADVGQSRREEINFHRAGTQGGQNFGWNVKEGNLNYKPQPLPPNLVAPIYEYEHPDGAQRSVIGGYVYRGAVSQLQGTYFFADYITGQSWSFRYQNNQVNQFQERTSQLIPPTGQGEIIKPTSWGEDAAGNLYIITDGGRIYRLEVKKTVTGTASNENLFGGPSDDILIGLAGNDLLKGLGDNDRLWGGAGNDTLIGGQGLDFLTGGLGTDSLTSGEGKDRFIFATGVAFNNATMGIDQMVDFTVGQDRIILDRLTFTALTSQAGQGFSVASEFAIVTTNAAAATSSAMIVLNTINHRLFYNPNGASAGFGTGGAFAVLANGIDVSASDFQIRG